MLILVTLGYLSIGNLLSLPNENPHKQHTMAPCRPLGRKSLDISNTVYIKIFPRVRERIETNAEYAVSRAELASVVR